MTSENTHQHICPCCNEPIEPGRLPLDYSFRLPDDLLMMSKEDQEDLISSPHTALKSVMNEFFYIRGLVELPVVGTDQTLAWGTWIQVSKQDYEKFKESLFSDDPKRGIVTGHIMGLLANTFPELYPDCRNLIVAACDREDMAMFFQLEPTDHPLSVEQYNGITIERVHEIALHMGIRHE